MLAERMCVDKFFVILLACIAYHDVEALSDCPPSSLSTTPVKLKNALTCNYDSSARPVVTHSKATNVSFRILLKYFSYDVTTSTLSLDAWMPTFWNDEHLKWKPSDYDNISKMTLDTYEIWTPDLSVYNRATQGGDPTALASGTKCIVSSQGSVFCVPSVHIDALCVPDLSMYPFDSQKCVLRMGSWIHKGEEVNVKLMKGALNLDELESNGEWEIANYSSKRYAGIYPCCPNSTYPSIEMIFELKRLSGAHAASVIIPTIVVMILTFTSLLLSPLNKDRLILCCVNVIAQFMHVQYMSWQIPLKGDQIPLLLLFARDSLLLAVFTVVITLVNKSLMQKGTAPPHPVSVLVSYVVENRVGQFIFLEDGSLKAAAAAKEEEDSATIINTDSSKSSTAWSLFGKILDFLSLIIYIVVYFTLFMKFIP